MSTAQLDEDDLPISNKTFLEELKESGESIHAQACRDPAWAAITSALNEDMRSMDPLRKAAFVPARVALTLLILYYGDETYSLNVRKLAQLFPTVSSPDRSHEWGERLHVDGELHELPLHFTKECSSLPFRFSEFLEAARQLNPLYAILPGAFITWIMLLDNWIRRLLPTAAHMQLLWHAFYSVYAKRFRDPRWVRDFTLDIRPIFLTGLCLVPPAVILMMGYCSIQALMEHALPRKKPISGVQEKFGQQCLILNQSLIHQATRQDNFYSSGWFSIIVAIPYLIGIPTAITLWIYFNLGIDAQLSYPSFHSKFFENFVIIGSYLYCLGTCLTLLFFRSYFAFALNFDSQDFDIEVYPDMIKRLPIKGWFYDYFTLGAREMPTQIPWAEVEQISFATNRWSSEQVTERNAFTMLIRKICGIYESLAERMRTSPDFICIRGKTGTRISIQLWNLSYQQKLDLFQALRSYCPQTLLDEKVQTALVGCSVMKEERYTQIWFDVLTAGEQQYCEGDLRSSQSLRNGQYQVKTKIASGGQATVYEGETQAGDIVVLKEFRLATDESLDAKMQSAREFENESAILSQFEHESIVKMLDMFYESGRMYIVLEHVNGKTLRQVIRDHGVMNKESVLNCAQQMLEILRYLHRQEPPVVHRDFTPENIIVQENGRLKLIDFSIAKSMAVEKIQGECAGKHSYTPPEQFAGKACPQSDIYALGCTLYFLATGQDAEPITKSRLPDELATQMPILNDIIANCTDLDLEQRYSSAEWILADLEKQDNSEECGEESVEACSKEIANESGEVIEILVEKQPVSR